MLTVRILCTLFLARRRYDYRSESCFTGEARSQRCFVWLIHITGCCYYISKFTNVECDYIFSYLFYMIDRETINCYLSRTIKNYIRKAFLMKVFSFYASAMMMYTRGENTVNWIREWRQVNAKKESRTANGSAYPFFQPPTPQITLPWYVGANIAVLCKPPELVRCTECVCDGERECAFVCDGKNETECVCVREGTSERVRKSEM